MSERFLVTAPQADALSRLNIPVATLVCSAQDDDLRKGRLVFSGPRHVSRALDLGVFYLAIPDGLNLSEAREFGHSLLMPDNPLRNVPCYGALEGFIALDNNQQTKLALRRERWDAHYPPEIARFGRQLDGVGIAIMREVLLQAGIPETLWEAASGGYVSGEGTAFLNFVHYDTRQPVLGLRPHTDYGFVTILDASAPGLQIEVNGAFVDVPVLADHFVINFGEALRYVTAHSRCKVGAVTHLVGSQRSADPIRHSIVYFANPDLDGVLWQFTAGGNVAGQSSVSELFAHLERQLTQ